MLQPDWLILYTEQNFYRWLADVVNIASAGQKPLGQLWLPIFDRQSDRWADIGPTMAQRWNVIWNEAKLRGFTVSSF